MLVKRTFDHLGKVYSIPNGSGGASPLFSAWGVALASHRTKNGGKLLSALRPPGNPNFTERLLFRLSYVCLALPCVRYLAYRIFFGAPPPPSDVICDVQYGESSDEYINRNARQPGPQRFLLLLSFYFQALSIFSLHSFLTRRQHAF